MKTLHLFTVLVVCACVYAAYGGDVVALSNNGSTDIFEVGMNPITNESTFNWYGSGWQAVDVGDIHANSASEVIAADHSGNISVFDGAAVYAPDSPTNPTNVRLGHMNWHPDFNQNVQGVAVGDINPSLPGNEVVAVSTGGNVITWQGSDIASASGGWVAPATSFNWWWVEARAVEIADVHAATPGNEVVFADALGNINVWDGQSVSTAGAKEAIVQLDYFNWGSQSIQDIAVGELDPTHAGLEIIAVAGNGNIGIWSSDDINYNNDGGAVDPIGAFNWYGVPWRGVDIGDVDPLNPGNEIVLVDNLGNMNIFDGLATATNFLSNNGSAVNQLRYISLGAANPFEAVSVIPEPATIAMLFAGSLLFRRKRQH